MSHGDPEADLLRGGEVTGGSDDEVAIIKGPAGMVDNLGRPGWWRGWLHQPGVLGAGQVYQARKTSCYICNI